MSIETKLCKCCELELPYVAFHKCNQTPTGLASYCRDCRSSKAKVYGASHREINHARYLEQREKKLAYERSRRADPRARAVMAANKYRYMRLPSTRAKRNARRAERYVTDVNFKLYVNAKARIRMALKRYMRHTGLVPVTVRHKLDLLGCTIAEYRKHVELQFTEGMTWDNYGKWHIDHITPVASFNLSDTQQLRSAFNYTNVRPLWATDNLSRPRKINLSPADLRSTLFTSNNGLESPMSMTKDGEVRVNSTPCDMCSQPATLLVGNTARCPDHMDTKEASVTQILKSFTEPLEA